MRNLVYLVALAIALPGCLDHSSGGDEPDLSELPDAGDTGDGATPDMDPPRVALCDTAAQGATYHDIAGNQLGFDRVDIYTQPANAERARLKEQEHLLVKFLDGSIVGEFRRVAGNVAISNPTAANIKSLPGSPGNWYNEPRHSSITAYAMALGGFGVCYNYLNQSPAVRTDDPFDYVATDPTSGTVAKDQCRKMARKFWSATPTQGEVDSCAAVAVSQTADPAATVSTKFLRRWSLACSSLLTSAHFLTY